ncbi:exodeoxyribonuclease VII small subunit [Novibacillus thermophilus]|jgi:exodeoxyribonuclease VII small subunit|uniref:Exodeoxyribonuclease 7 small subunit n=1 Tax=Novibacillus thermophilus TaxID=1471761 RepID=A0A1U9K998_9BACL|nr:exodeoxyribonuclease VII small subunit [Novibacillus thermophilus]AQS56598.1 exodeoxyribonuclease VII small subunit [Novibacillus thermophilus]
MVESKENQYETLTFEEALKRLEEVVQKLEDGDVPLEEAIDLFQEGMALSKRCSQQLDKAEQRIEMLMEENGEWTKKPFAPEED